MTSTRKTCAIVSSRFIDEDDNLTELRDSLYRIFLKLIVYYDVKDFYFDCRCDFEKFCMDILNNLKLVFPFIQKVYCSDLPDGKPRFGCDKAVYIPIGYKYWKKALYFRNCAMTDNCDYSIFYIRNFEDTDTLKAQAYAQRKKHTKMIYI